ncbi:bifunctional precorrin-2 dehydrogenase/sirohydrochlorin ferrochelatase [Thalassotalea sp. PS06]|uniref:precorrin-2 dehydrogenase/sirohydrochlorin ferrochelatase family protein n=1 Tax=Thalassotalea sp. PS06 TaxID=2594005 RepID=UPI0011632B35|nr:bifunctional precorrin-2 dehydrogenase/sirohydrochlorin ferrochelatase [Thalassotalea sp. PS06]QDP00098.1 hypothetical protein FNC98_01270 [Thalassotalea sp. PS06]
MQYFPVFLDAEKLSVIVVGGGSVAARKIELVSKTPAKITIISPEINNTVATLIERHGINWQQSIYEAALLKDAHMVIAATSDEAVNAKISEDAGALNMLVNVVDSPELCTYITPAIIDRDPMLIALSSSGSAPILLQMLKTQIEQVLPAQYGKLADFCGLHRKEVQATIDDFATRKAFWQEVLTGTIAQMVMDDEADKAEQAFVERLTTFKQNPNDDKGTLSLVIANDNNPDLLTLAAYQAMQIADIVFLESGLNQRFYEFARRDSEKAPVFALKEMTEAVQAGQRVVVIATRSDTIDELKRQCSNVYASGSF